jgi:hypothetical protein
MPISAEVATLFLDELARRDIAVSVDEEGYYIIDRNSLTCKINLENLSRDYAQDRDPERVVHFVNAILSQMERPEWTEAEGRIRWQAEPGDHDFGEVLRDAVSDSAVLVLVVASADDTQLRWLILEDLAHWGKTEEELWETAAGNMAQILRDATIETDDIDGHKLGMIATEHVDSKAALLFAPNLKEIVEPVMGWPIYAVMPCRDFVYIINKESEELLGRLGSVVVREYRESGYPVTTEIFEITEESVRAIGSYQVNESDENEIEVDEASDMLKTIHYRGGIVSFRIPAGWVEEYEEDGGGTFYDEDSDTGTLRLTMLTLHSQTPVTTRTAIEALEAYAEEYEVEIVELGDGNALIHFEEQEEEDGEELTMFYWQIANVVPPDHFRIALFSYTVLTSQIDDEGVQAELEMLHRELRSCRFSAELGE